MTPYEKWDVVMIPFPFSDFTAHKRRPAIVVSSAGSNTDHEITVLFVTSNLKSPAREGDHTLEFWKEAGFPKPSMVRMKFVSIHRSVIIKKFGRILESDQAEILKKLLVYFSS